MRLCGFWEPFGRPFWRLFATFSPLFCSHGFEVLLDHYFHRFCIDFASLFDDFSKLGEIVKMRLAPREYHDFHLLGAPKRDIIMNMVLGSLFFMFFDDFGSRFGARWAPRASIFRILFSTCFRRAEYFPIFSDLCADRPGPPLPREA